MATAAQILFGYWWPVCDSEANQSHDEVNAKDRR